MLSVPKRTKVLKWGEVLGDPTCPYMRRWIIDLGLLSLRLHKFYRSDDDRCLHDHPWWFVSLLLSGSYREHTEKGVSAWRRIGSLIARPARWKHAVEIKPGRACWTLVLTGRRARVWGFWLSGKFCDSRRYFGLFGHPPCKD